KNGGNVVSYFLTPRGGVINAVVGPVDAGTLLQEARWAVENYQRARNVSRNNLYTQASVIGLAHANLAGDRVHKLLAQNPLVGLPLIQQQIFEKLAGQQVSQDRSRVAMAAAAFDRAAQKGIPVLLVLGKPQAKPGEWDAATGSVLGALGMAPFVRPARSCAIVALPIDELPALTNIVNLPEFHLAERDTPTMVLTKSDGTQLASISPVGNPREIVGQLWDGVNQCRVERAERLLAEGKQRDAVGLLQLVKSSPQPSPLKDRAVERLAELKGGSSARAERPQSATPPAEGETSVADRYGLAGTP
ncbi:MAG TPA: hypothetical protein VG125_16180, partial [Pirellulales bacterium]|nr:hypothetical protein [Pirellulales bacterium]